MAILFQKGELQRYLGNQTQVAVAAVERIAEDEFLAESVESLVERFSANARCQALVLHADRWVGGDVEDTTIDVTGDPMYSWPGRDRTFARGTIVTAEYAWEGNRQLFEFQPSERLLISLEGEVLESTLRISYRCVGDATPEQARTGIVTQVERIAQMIKTANNDAQRHNERVESEIRTAIEERRSRVLTKRELKGALGFEISRRSDAPRAFPLDRKILGPIRRANRPVAERTYADEWALDEADYEDIITLVSSMLRAFERSPSTVSVKDEEALRDLLLIILNGTYRGAATGETFVAAGKTDILVRVEDRHVFVGECKWWRGAKAFSSAIDQLLSYLPWRDEKAARLVFIGGKDASRVIDGADVAIREHPAFKRAGRGSSDPSVRRDYVLGHPDDPEREIRVALLFSVIRDSAD